MSDNQHISDYLDYYLSLKTPKYAVMLNGRWGIGKTHFLDEYFKKRSSIEKAIRVSIYGISKPEELDDVVFKAAYALFDNQAVKVAGGIIRSAAKVFKVETDLKAKDFLNKVAAADIYVFDDIERCDLPINSVLGYINQFVEHADRKVIVVANEEEIRRKDKEELYDVVREKVIGKTLTLQPVVEQAFSCFISAIEDTDCKALIIEQKLPLLLLYRRSDSKNLRILQQTLWDFERFYGVLGERYRASEPAMQSMLGLFFTLSFDIKAGLLSRADLQTRDQSLFFVSKNHEDTRPITQTRRRYPDVDITSNVLSNQTLVDILIDGFMDVSAIQKDLDSSRFFVKVEDEPAWRTVWSGYERTEEEFNEALSTFNQQFLSRQFSSLGEIYHAFGLKLWLSKIEVTNQTADSVVEDCEKYVQDLYASGRIPTEKNSLALIGGHAGLGIYEAETPEFATVRACLDCYADKARKDRYPQIAQNMLSLMSERPDELFGSIAYVDGGENIYYSIPFWPAIAASLFASRLVSLSGENQRKVFVALQGRYDGGFLQRELSSEKEWLRQVRDALLEEATQMSPIARSRTRSYVQHSIEKILEAN